MSQKETEEKNEEEYVCHFQGKKFENEDMMPHLLYHLVGFLQMVVSNQL